MIFLAPRRGGGQRQYLSDERRAKTWNLSDVRTASKKSAERSLFSVADNSNVQPNLLWMFPCNCVEVNGNRLTGKGISVV